VLAGRIGASRQRLLEGTAGRSLFSAGAAVATNKQYLRPRHSVTSQAARDIIVTVVNRTMRTPSVKAAVADIIVAGTDRRKPGQSRRVSGVRTPQGASIGHPVSRLGAVDGQVRPVSLSLDVRIPRGLLIVHHASLFPDIMQDVRGYFFT